MPYMIDPSYEILFVGTGSDGAAREIERSARLCYKSEYKITVDSDESMVRRLIISKHHAMLELGGVVKVRFVSDRGFTHEMVRHRLISAAQESTRYCNYSKSRFGNRITVISIPDDWLRQVDIGCEEAAQIVIDRVFATCEAGYFELLSMGVPAEIARSVLPIGLKAEIDIMADFREWRHIFMLRCSRQAHPRMRQLMLPLLRDMDECCPYVFDDIAEKYLNITSAQRRILTDPNICFRSRDGHLWYVTSVYEDTGEVQLRGPLPDSGLRTERVKSVLEWEIIERT